MSEKINSRDKLVRTASRLFQMQGYHGTGLNQITKESGSPKGSLYHYFPEGKEQLAVEAIKMTTTFVAERVHAGMNKTDEPVKAIQVFINDLADQLENEGGEGGVPIALMALETSLMSETLRNECQTSYRTIQEIFAKKLVDADFGKERAKELSTVINAMIEGAFLLSFTMDDTEPLRLVAQKIPLILK